MVGLVQVQFAAGHPWPDKQRPVHLALMLAMSGTNLYCVNYKFKTWIGSLFCLQTSYHIYRVSGNKPSLRKMTFYTKIQKLAIKMTFATIIGPKNTEHNKASNFRFKNQKSQFTKLIWDKNQEKKLKCFEKRGKNQCISIYLGGERSKAIQSGPQ